jgi:predicted enzyme related to lactoylglutathione lyase
MPGDGGPPPQQAMLNLRVDDLDTVLDRLTEAGVTVDPKRESYGFGRFGWFVDPEGNRVELWEPTASG